MPPRPPRELPAPAAAAPPRPAVLPRPAPVDAVDTPGLEVEELGLLLPREPRFEELVDGFLLIAGMAG